MSMEANTLLSAQSVPLSTGRQPSVPNFKRDPRKNQKKKSNKKWVLVGSLRVPATNICLGSLLFLINKDFLKLNMALRAEFWNVNLGPPVSAKQPINVQSWDILVLLNQLNNDAFIGCSEISISAKYWALSGLFVCLRGLSFSVPRGTGKLLGCGFLGGISNCF